MVRFASLDVLHLQHLSGSKRLTRLHSAVLNGKDGPDVDLRYIKKPMSLVGLSQDSVRSDIVSFLSSVYESVAETLPDVRDTAFDGIEAAHIPSIGHMDSYCIELNRQSAENFEEADENHISSRRRFIFPQAKGKAKPRKKRKALELNMDRTHGPGAKEVKFLPPGFMKEYYQQYRMVSSLEKPASFPSFWRAPWLELCQILKLGRESHIVFKRIIKANNIRNISSERRSSVRISMQNRAV